MKISWIIMTHSDKTATKSVKYNLNNAGSKVDEIIWVNNGGKDEDFIRSIADRIIINKDNLGIAKGYNPAFAIASGDYILITGSDTKMPDNWLKTYREYIDKIPNTGIAVMLNTTPDKAPERIRGEKQTINGLDLIPVLPLGFRIIRKDILKECGYLREDFGLYGWDDIEWAERIVSKTSFLCYMIPDMIPVHDIFEETSLEYADFKRKEVSDEKKSLKMSWCRDNNYPIYNPYG